MNQLDPAVRTIWGISFFIRTTVYSALFLLAEFLIISRNMDWFAPTGFTSAGIFLIGLVLTFVYPPLYYRFWRFDVRDDELYLERGVITRVSTTAPYVRIQHLDVEQSFLDRMYGLGKLVVYTAGSRGADLVIPGLPIDYAEALRDRLKNITAEDEV